MEVNAMSVAKTVEITASSPSGFEDAIQTGITRAADTIDRIQGAWVSEQKVVVEGTKVTEYRVTMRVTFLLND
jgi:dodecin